MLTAPCTLATKPDRAMPDAAATARAATYRDAMSRAVTGVSIVATAGSAGRFGMTVSAVTSVSAEPPLLLVCINRRSPLADAIVANGVFAVSLLSLDQRSLAESFAGGRLRGRAYDFELADWSQAEAGAPMLDSAVASFDCRLDRAFDAGTHRVFLGAVIDCRTSNATPLAYLQRAYGSAEPIASNPTSRATP